jgi:hypothetical protein
LIHLIEIYLIKKYFIVKDKPNLTKLPLSSSHEHHKQLIVFFFSYSFFVYNTFPNKLFYKT